MMGQFDVSLLGAQGLEDQDFLAASKKGDLDRLLARLPVEKKCRVRNQVFDNFAAYFFDHAMQGAQVGYPYYLDSGNAMLSNIILSNNQNDPTYTEDWGAYTGIHNITGSVNTSTAGKRFIEDDVDTPQLAVLASGQEGIVFKSRWLYLPSQGNPTAGAPVLPIRAITAAFCRDGDTTGSIERGLCARVALKDDQGRQISIWKTSSQVLLVEYEFTLLSV